MPRRLIAATALALAATVASASSAAAQQQAAVLAPRRNVLTTQPINVIAGFYNIEYERAISHGTTLGLQANIAGDEYGDLFDDFDDDEGGNYFSADSKVRYYPGGEAFKGFSIAGTAGVTRLSSREYRYDCTPDFGCTPTGDRMVSATGAKLGFELDYNWLLGVDERFVVAVGVGAKRLILEDRRTEEGFRSVDYPEAYPTARIAIGFAF